MKNNTRKTLTGILLIVLAVCLILWKLNIFNLPTAFANVSAIGLVIAALMVIIIFQSIIDGLYGGIFIPLAVICIIFDEPLGITAITPWIVLIAAVLLSIAFHVLFPHHKKDHRHAFGENDHRSDKFSENFNESDDGSVVFGTQFGSSTRYIRSQNLTSADLSSSFGEMSVFFDKSQVPGKRVDIDCRVSFGAMNVYIPDTWKVENRVSVTMGHCDIQGTNPPFDENTVVCSINGSVSFGELKLVRVPQHQ